MDERDPTFRSSVSADEHANAGQNFENRQKMKDWINDQDEILLLLKYFVSLLCEKPNY